MKTLIFIILIITVIFAAIYKTHFGAFQVLFTQLLIRYSLISFMASFFQHNNGLPKKHFLTLIYTVKRQGFVLYIEYHI